jgi:UDP-N-acetylmuramate--alanine ligase
MSAVPKALWQGRRMHFIGVGGAGMSGYARAAHALGARVSGSDRGESPYLERLRTEGVLEASVGHDAANVPAGDDVEVVYSSAIPPENPERTAARERGLAERPRAELLGELSALRRTVAVAGTHGKTTTCSMVVHALRGAGMDPGWLIGAEVGGGLPNAHWSEGEWLVVEADESDRSMLALAVEVAVVTNVELDHHTAYGSLRELREVFRAFLVTPAQAVIWDRPELLALRAGPCVPYGAPEQLESRKGSNVAGGAGGPDADELEAEGPDDARESSPAGSKPPKLGQRFLWRGHVVDLEVPGAHNALNAVGALEAAQLAGAEPAGAVAGLAGFTGAERRFQLVGIGPGGAAVYEDYAHHPTEIEATLRATRTLEHERLVAVFQPHLYSRTERLARELGQALALADVAIVLDVYPARESAVDHPGVSGLRVADAAADAAAGRPVYWLPTCAAAEPVLRGVLRAGDLCLVMGAGDVNALARRLVKT